MSRSRPSAIPLSRTRRSRGTMLRALPHLCEPGWPTLRAAAWALRALRRLRRELSRDGLDVRVLAPPRLDPRGIRGVESALRFRGATCLERSLIVQRWLVAHGNRHEVAVGVAGGADAVDAHAWILGYDGDEPTEGYSVLTCVAPLD
jgi:hypothetical protein